MKKILSVLLSLAMLLALLPLGVVADSTVATLVENPRAGVAYKFGMVQGNVSATDVYYLVGNMSGYYMATSTDIDAAIDVYLEATNGGYHLYGMINGVKTYINMVVSGTHVNGAYESTASTVYTYDADSDTLVAVINDNEYWFGTRNDKSYTTVGPVNIVYNGFYCKLYETGVAVEPETPNVPEYSPNDIVDAAYALTDGEELPGTHTLTGIVTSICTDYTAEGDYITIMLTVPGSEGKALMCYQLQGVGVSELAIGDTATVSGTIAHYNGHPEFTDGCVLVSYEPGYQETVDAPADAATILEDAYSLLNGMATPYIATLTGTVTAINEVYSDEFSTVTATLVVAGYEDKPIRCYRMIGEAASTLKVGDKIAVTGRLQNFFGMVEFHYKSTFISVESETLTIPAAIELGLAQGVNSYTSDKYYVTGKVVAISNSIYGNIYIVDENDNLLLIYGSYNEDGTVRFDGMENQPEIGDTITVYGIVGTYNGNEAQMKNVWITDVIKGEGVEDTDPPADSTLTIEEAIALGISKQHNIYTERKYYVSGEITEIYNDMWGNMYITDENGNILTLYGTWSEDGSVRFDGMANRPEVGDTITVYGIIGQYNGNPQMKNGWIQEDVPKEHFYDNACDDVCNVCGYTRIPADHVYSGVCDEDCNECGWIREAENHIYDAVCDAECNVCGILRSATHRYYNPAAPVCADCGVALVCDTPTIYGVMDKHTMADGGIVTLTVMMANNPGVAGWQVHVDFDTNALELIGQALGAEWNAIGANYNFSKIETQSPAYCLWAEFVRGVNYDMNGVLFTLTFKVKNGAAYGDYTFDVYAKTSDDICNIDFDNVSFAFVDTAITIEEHLDHTYDDCSDAVCNVCDYVREAEGCYGDAISYIDPTCTTDGSKIFCCVNCGSIITESIPAYGHVYDHDYDADCNNCGEVREIPVLAGDVNGDNTVSMIDIALLQRYLNGWDVELKWPADLSAPDKILAAAFALQPGDSLSEEVTLTGKVVAIEEAYSDTYGNITLSITVGGKTLKCYRMKGNGIENIKEGDTITVKGYITNYNGNVQFGQGCEMTKRVAGTASGPETDQDKILADAFSLAPGASLSYKATLTGTITDITTEYSPQYKNLTVIIAVGDKTLKCYRMKGAGAENLKEGDTITVTGIIKNYMHSSGDCEVEFDQGCTFVFA